MRATIGDNRLQCMTCGEEYPLHAMPMWEFTAITGAFQKEHRACQPNPEAVGKRFAFSTLDEWLRSWDTGASARTIASALAYVYIKEPATPQDADDFGRCYRLVKNLDWTKRLPDVETRYPEWAMLVEAWDELCLLYDGALQINNATALNARLNELNGAISGKDNVAGN